MAGSGRQARGRASGFWVALAAAYLLAVQMLLSGMAIGAAAASPERIYGDSLCRGGAASDPAGGPDGGQDGGPHLPGCCLAGCAMFGGGTAPPPGGVAVPAPVPAGGDLPAVSAEAPVLLPLDQTPRRTRAPPAVA